LRISVFLEVLYGQEKLAEVIDGLINRILTVPRVYFRVGILDTFAFGTPLLRVWQYCVFGWGWLRPETIVGVVVLDGDFVAIMCARVVLGHD
jgi:hypothetical protein